MTETPQRPLLDRHILPEEFAAWYWHSRDLKQFCREVGIDALGGKLELSRRIMDFLRTGQIAPPTRQVREVKTEIQGQVTDDTVIPENVLLTGNMREYFEARVKGRFRFSKELIAFFRANSGKTMAHALAFYLGSMTDRPKRTPGSSKIPRQCQYNQFVRDYLADNKGAAFADAVAAWKVVRDGRSDFRYHRKDLAPGHTTGLNIDAASSIGGQE